ncbi:tyrosine-protein phosphatase [Chitinophaga qingshengii]|uniref:protein-tyrosine-phosphatase n=1 Tax=Chitinophaga qingshengii TaxID=1569794 RepID=A0ABR7TV43_9BACT|nr:CpsB/CapC family capsule biosynthesis tyrosine phosphatase [Chitinophaga qingshengii]MBC9934354.1 histidinol phosphatase [Chitinophaga qingshengii]
MFLFRNKPKESGQLTELLSFMETDIHSHLLPGIDDGVPDTDTAVHFIEQLHHMGIRKIITTPHVMMDRYPNSAQTMAGPYREVSAALEAKGLNIPFHYAAEYFMDEQFEELMQRPLLTLTGKLVLVEMSFMSAPPQLHRWIFELAAQGYLPLLAHPERYNYCHHDFDSYRQFKQWGCLFQVNLLSLTGYYGKHIQQAAEKLIEHDMIDYIGTDLHHDKHLHAITQIGKNKKLRALLEKYPFKNRTL